MTRASMIRASIVLLPMVLLTACGGGRFAGFDNCSADGSPVLIEYPNANGNYDTLNNGPCKSR